MKKQSIFRIMAAAAIVFAFNACTDPDPIDEPTPKPDNGSNPMAYVLNEGSWGGNNAELSKIDLTTGAVDATFFSSANGRGLGDLACDVLHYGSKLYVTVSESGTIEVIDPKTGKSVKQIDLGDRYPRYIAAHNGQLYISCYTPHSIIRIDTASLTIAQSCNLGGNNPEQLCIAGDNIYVCSGYTSDQDGNFYYDSTLSVVNINSFSETGRITVGCNPKSITALDDHRVLVGCLGDYGANPAQALVYDLNQNHATALSAPVTIFDHHNGTIYGYTVSYDAEYNATATFYSIDAQTLQATQILQGQASTLASAYGINVNPANGPLVITTSAYNANGDAHCVSPQGSVAWKAEVGLYPCKTVF